MQITNSCPDLFIFFKKAMEKKQAREVGCMKRGEGEDGGGEDQESFSVVLSYFCKLQSSSHR
jgi:hypothetical protein